MSKRVKHEQGGSSSSSSAGAEAKLHELQTYTYDLLVKNNARKEGSVRSTRAFADPLLATEIKLLRQREAELVQRVADLERERPQQGSSATAGGDEMRKLAAANEELRSQMGDITTQTRLLQLDAKDKTIQKLTLALAEAKRQLEDKDKQQESLAAQVFLLQRQLTKSKETNGAPQGGDDDFDSFFNDKPDAAEADQMNE